MVFTVPWIQLAILLPLLGAAGVRSLRSPDLARRVSLAVCGLALVASLGAWAEFGLLDTSAVHDPWDPGVAVGGEPLWVIDALSAPLLPLGCLLYALTVLATLRTKVRKLSFSGLLLSLSLLVATFSCRQPWVIIALLTAGTLPVGLELSLHQRPIRLYVLHMGLFVVLLVAGQGLATLGDSSAPPSTLAIALLMAAVLVRSGVVPLHGWMCDLFEQASFTTALLFVTPMVGVYAAMRLVFPLASDWALHAIALFSLVTALYAAGMALVQRDARRFFAYIFLSHSSLVLVGLETVTPLGLTGALYAWLAVAISMAGFGLTLRCIEARTGRLSLDRFHGLYDQTPALAVLFLISGLASVGFPGTVGFVGAELLVEGAVQVSPLVGAAVVVVSALNGLAVMQAYFRVFTGSRHVASIDLGIRLPERIAVLTLIALTIGGGLYPQPNVVSRYEAATQLIKRRAERFESLARTGRLPATTSRAATANDDNRD